ncbi:hypothetical protein FKG96_19780 [Olivibacter sp. LS-1]|uniref:hypothetical protein n=1 Tax=Olivibacter sp. LS-1 TaxID=2592345 RepID=UPI0011EB1DB6|nr:hypothetical protein [Olivibacter sp. LS-1]QEL02966.1 hypothetical protein FKG96_19780 [Olivibacter sp. LS-1]
MKVTSNHTFHFLTEISKENTYSLLFPEAKAGLAIVWLYEQMQKGIFPQDSFKEKDIHEALRTVNPAIENDKSRHPREHYNALISNLLEYFLRYDEERQEYSFKQYAYIFCQQAHDILKATFSPTRIEKICFALYDKLKQSKDLDTFLDWFHIDFDAFKLQLKSQLDFLDRQIDQSVASLRENKKLSLQEGTILETLQQIDERFELIRAQNKELRTAFREIEQIRRLIESNALAYDHAEVDARVHEAITFFQEMRRTLSIIDKRLDRIQPKIKQLFSNLNKPLFNTRIERFLYHLVENSIEVIEGSKKTIRLPGNIPPLSVFLLEQDLTIVERKPDLFPVKPKKRLMITETPEMKASVFASFQNRLNQQDEISQWIGTLQREVDMHDQLRLSDYFFQIAKPDDPHTLTLAIAVIYRAMGFFEGQEQYMVSIDPGKIIHNTAFKTSLWEIIIRRKT